MLAGPQLASTILIEVGWPTLSICHRLGIGLLERIPAAIGRSAESDSQARRRNRRADFRTGRNFGYLSLPTFAANSTIVRRINHKELFELHYFVLRRL